VTIEISFESVEQHGGPRRRQPVFGVAKGRPDVGLAKAAYAVDTGLKGIAAPIAETLGNVPVSTPAP
jgi:hypothetical protein